MASGSSSLRVRLLLLVLLSVTPALGLILATAIQQRSLATEHAQKDVRRLADVAAIEQEQMITGTGQILGAVAREPGLLAGDPTSYAAIFSGIVKYWPWIANMGMIRPNGDVSFSVVSTSGTINAAYRSYFQRAVQTRDFAIGDFEISRITHSPVLYFAYPVLDETSKVASVVFAALDLDWLNRVESRIDAQLPSGSALSIIDGNGVVLVHKPDPEKWVGKRVLDRPLFRTVLARREGLTESSGLDGVRRFYAFTLVRGTSRAGNMFVVVGTPKAVAYGEPNRLLVHSLVWFGVVTALALMAAWFGADVLVLKMVRALLRATDRLGAGDLSARAGPPYGQSEIGQLSRAFDQMAETLEQREVERKRAEETLRSSEEYFRSLIENTSDIVVVINADRTLRYISPSAERMLGHKPEERLGKDFIEFIHPDDAATLAQVFEDMVQKPGFTVVVEFRARHEDGSWRVLEGVGRNLLHNPAVGGLVTSLRDITERKQLEERLSLSQRMEAVGKLAGGIAHDFNNLLTAVTGYSELLLGRLNEADPLRKDVLEIRKAAEHATSLTRQLLAFSRRQVLQPKVMKINTIVVEMDTMLRRLIGEDIDLVTVLGAKVGYVKADPVQIEQVILNLVINARDAMPNGGRLTIETANVELDEAYARRHADVRPGSYVMLAVSDTGCGMDEKTKSRLFEPFFTTKGLGKGTGLGLSTIYGIVKQSDGHIWVYSEPGQGTTFKTYLPRVEEAVEKPESTATRAGPTQGSETILVVEDEVEVAKLVREILEINGYRVLEAHKIEEALRIGQTHEGPIHVMITDVVMPGMSGRQLAERLISVRPQMKVLYMSGYTEDAIVHHGVLDEGTAFIQKPFTPDDLTRQVRDVLDNPQYEKW